MRNLIIGVLACVVIIPGRVLAEDVNWLAKDDPSSLFALTSVGSDCLISKKKMDELVKGVMIRSRIKPAESWGPLDLVLNVGLECKELESNNPFFDLSVKFERLAPPDDDQILVTSLMRGDYGLLGIGDQWYVSEAIKISTEAAITEFLKANFDLGGD